MTNMTDTDREILDDHLWRHNQKTCPCTNVRLFHVQLQDEMVVRTCSVCFHVQLFAWVPLKMAVESHRRTFFSGVQEG